MADKSSKKDEEDDERTMQTGTGQTRFDLDLKLDEPAKDGQAKDAQKKPEGPPKGEVKKTKKSKSKDKTKPSKKNKGIFNTFADKLLSKIPKGGTKKETNPATRERTPNAESPAPKDEKTTELPKHIKDYITTTLEIEKTQTLKQYFFNTLCKIAPPATYTAFNANMAKNQSPDIFCNEENRVKLKSPADPAKSDYIHANYIKFEGLKRCYIATQHPMQSTAEDFLAMCFAEEVDTIVSLSPIEGFFKYFPTEKDGYINYQRLSVTCKFMKPGSKYTPAEYTLDVLPNGCSNSVLVRVLKYPHWGKYQVPASPKVVTSLVTAIKKSRGPIVVQCETGVNQTSAFIYIDATLSLLDAGITPTLESVFRELRGQRHSALSQRLHFSYSVYAILVVLKVLAKRANQSSDCLKGIDSFERDMAPEFAKAASPEPSDPKASSPTLDQTIG